MGAGLSGSLSCCHFLCELSRLFLRLHFTHFLIFSSCLSVLCSGGTPQRVFLHFFRKGFCTRACTDFLCKLTQERRFFATSKKWVQKILKSTWAPASQGPSLVATFYAPGPRLLLRLHFTHFLIFSSCLSVLCSGGTAERVFLHFFRKGFCTRACTDFLCKLTQERLFVQRRKREYKRSYTVRGMGPPQGPAFACTVTTINKTKKKKLKNTSFVKILDLSNILVRAVKTQHAW